MTTLTPGSIGGLEIKQAAQITPYLNMMVYGGSGVGKTLFTGTAGTIEEMSPMLFIDVEDGELTLSALPDAKIDIVSLTEWKKLQKIYNELYDGKHSYRTVAIDSGTEVQKLAMNDVLGTTGRIIDTGITPEFKDWYKNTEQIRRMVRAFRDLPMNTIITALEMEHEDPRTHRKTKRPAFSNKLSGEIPAFFDAVYYMFVKEVKGDAPNERKLLTDRTDLAVAKSRIQGIPVVLDNPTVPTIYEYLMAQNTKGVK